MTDSKSSVPSQESKIEEEKLYQSFIDLRKSENSYNEYNNFVEEKKMDKLINKYINYKIIERIKIINNFITLIRDFKCEVDIPLGYKQKKLFPIVEILSRIIELETPQIIESLLGYEWEPTNDYNILINEFISISITTLHCTKFLKRNKLLIEMFINRKNKSKKLTSDLDRFLILSASSGSGPSFMFWVDNFFTDNSYLTVSENIFVGYKSSKFRKPLLSFASSNSDDRIFKFLVKKIEETKTQAELLGNVKQMELVINAIFSRHIDSKFSLRRLKFLCNNNINLTYFSGFIMSCSRDVKEFNKLSKYYYKENVIIKDFDRLAGYIMKKYDSIGISVIDSFVKLLKTDSEKFNLIMQLLYNYGCIFEYKYNFNEYFKYDEKNLFRILTNIKYKFSYDDDDTCCYSCSLKKEKCLENTLRYLSKIKSYNNVLNNYFSKIKDSYENNLGIHNMSKMILFNSRFLVLDDRVKNKFFLRMNLRFNKVLHLLRKRSKKIFKRRATIIRAKEIMLNLNVTNKVKNNKNVFDDIPPRSLEPDDIKMLYSKNRLVKEKADGVLVNILPLDIYPEPPKKLMESKVKAEYLEINENIGLYLIFDIEMEGDVLSRYSYLRNSHEKVELGFDDINDWNDFELKLKKERNNFENFIKPFLETDDFVNLWYPKASWIILKGNNKIWDNMVHHLVLEKSQVSDLVCNKGMYPCDGLVIDHFEKQQEIKIKPLRLHTIDLMYSNNNWIDRDNCIWDVKSDDVSEDSIWRCYLEDDVWIAKERRFDKFKPNPNKIAKIIEKLAKTNWEKKYYHKKRKTSEITQFIPFFRKQVNFLKNYLRLMNPKKNSNWLDLGCGNGKLVRIIEEYNPKLYYGLDIDSFCISNIKKMKRSWVNYRNTDLNKNWLIEGNINYDYIIANFSITYYYSDNFWKKLNKYSKIGTLFLCNFLNDKAKNGFNEDGCSIETKGDKTTIFFPWCHKEKITEKFIEEKNFKNDLLRFGWKIYQKSIPPFDGLESYYSWFILVKDS